jgi:cell division transport system permease protein
LNTKNIYNINGFLYGVGMQNNKTVIKTMSGVVKFIAVALLCAFFILLTDHYYQINNYAVSLSKKLNIVVFFDKNTKEDKAIIAEVKKSTNLVSVKEYVNASLAYAKAIEKNPFLKNISVPSDGESIQAYAILYPISMPDKVFFSELSKNLKGVSCFDEIVFDASIFKQYVKIMNLIFLYKMVLLIFVLTVFVLFIIKCVLCILEQELNRKRFVKNILLYLVAAISGFFAVFVICTYVRYTLSISEPVILLVIMLAVTIGITLDGNYVKTS